MSEIKLDANGLVINKIVSSEVEFSSVKIGNGILHEDNSGKICWNDNTIENPDLSSYVTTSALNSKGYLTSTSLSDYAKKTDLNLYATTSSLSSYIKTSALKSYITATWQSGTSWYRKYSDGWIEQGGYVITSSSTEQTISLHTAFSNTNYFLTKQLGFNGFYGSGINGQYTSVWGLTTSSFKTYGYDRTGVDAFRWYACGY